MTYYYKNKDLRYFTTGAYATFNHPVSNTGLYVSFPGTRDLTVRDKLFRMLPTGYKIMYNANAIDDVSTYIEPYFVDVGTANTNYFLRDYAPSGTTHVSVICVGGGGGGGGAGSGNNPNKGRDAFGGGGGGGSSGAQAFGWKIPYTTDMYIYVGAGGAAVGGNGYKNNGVPGGAGGATFLANSYIHMVYANGGAGGNAGTAANGSNDGFSGGEQTAATASGTYLYTPTVTQSYTINAGVKGGAGGGVVVPATARVDLVAQVGQ